MQTANTFYQTMRHEAERLTHERVINSGSKMTQPGSLKHWLQGERPSDQSTYIKFGRVGEDLSKWMIDVSAKNLELLQSGVQIMSNKKKKDFDLLWRDPETNTIYLRELKGNIELDSEKLVATFTKVKEELYPELQTRYPGADINIGILNWGVFARDELSTGLTHIRSCERNGVLVEHMKEFTERLGLPLTRDNWKEIGLRLGNISLNNPPAIEPTEQSDVTVDTEEQLKEALERIKIMENHIKALEEKVMKNDCGLVV